MRAPWISSFFFAFYLIFSSNTLFGTGTEVSVVIHKNFSRSTSISSPQGSPTYFHYVYSSNPLNDSIANLSTTWTNHESSLRSINLTDGSRIRAILPRDGFGEFTCGFFCNGTCTSYLFAILMNYFDRTVIWSANRDNPVREGAILNFTKAGELVLQDVDGKIAWTTNTTGKSIVGMNLTEEGNLVLFDVHNSKVWQSFDHPTDCLVPGQRLLQGTKLIPSVSSTNWTAQKDLYSLQLTHEGLFAYVESNPPQVYYKKLIDGIHSDKETISIDFDQDGALCFYISSTKNPKGRKDYCFKMVTSDRFPPLFIKFMPDGHWKGFGKDGVPDLDLLTDTDFGECSYPLACGKNAICSGNKQCSCPNTDYFKAADELQPQMGCSQVTPLTCNATHDQDFIEVKNITYFTYTPDMENVDKETCKKACRNNCSCKAAIFKYYGSNSSNGSCDLPSELFTMSLDTRLLPNNASTFVKIQNVTSSPSSMSQSNIQLPKKGKRVVTVLGFTIGSLVLLIGVIGFTIFIVQKKKRDSAIEEEYLDQVPGLPTRFSYQELKTATDNFSKKLGEGGFGSVFKGTLEDGSQIAVKCLQGLVHVKKSFLAEVESIGSIHHVNLVQLRGFCAWSSQRLLVYEFMSNGSLDQWIYNGNRKHILEWVCRKKIILDIAKGLAYLHEECRHKIIHLDIKPQNILLDEEFNAKVSDFGLSKLMDRKQSQVISTMRGTPGYMAPEWLSSIITEKMDVYSFGIVLLEILCGRKNFDRSQPEESWHLLRVFQSCWEEGTLLSIVDRYSEDMQVHGTEVTEMMQVASWCLQTDFTKRPSMSSVVKVLEGGMNVESNLDYNFLDPRVPTTTIEHEKSSKPMLPSILSGPR